MKRILRIGSWFCIVLLVSTLVAANFSQENQRIGTIDVLTDKLIPVTTPNSSLLSNALLAQRTGVVLPPPEPDRAHTPLRGEIISPGADEFGFYVLLGDVPENKTNDSIIATFSLPDQPPIVVDEPIVIFQNLTLTNKENQTNNFTLNLWNYAGTVEEQLLKQFSSFNVTRGNTSLAQQAIFSISLSPLATETLQLTYTYPPIRQTVRCVERSLADLLPPGAIIQHTDLPLDTYLSKQCTVNLAYEQPEILFTPITVSLEDYPQLEGLIGYDESQQETVEVKNLQFEVLP